MEYLEGRILRLISRNDVPRFEELSIIFGSIAEAVDYAHQRGILHRISSQATFSLQRSNSKVLDFGIASFMKVTDTQV
jgi:serine/threonine protein kinase